MTRGWALRALAFLAAGAVLASGCAEKQEPSTSAPTTAAEASPTLPPLGPPDFPVPTEARQKTEAGVQAFTRYYIELSNRLLISLDSSPLRALSQGCEDCDSMARGLDKARAAGEHYEGGELAISWLSNAVVKGDSAEVAFLLQQAAVTVRNAQGSMVSEKSSDSFQISGGLSLSWDADRATWVVTTFTADRA